MSIRQGHGLSPYRCTNLDCPQEGEECLRAGRFVEVPEGTRAYRGEEKRLPEICTSCLSEMTWTPTVSAHDLLGESFVIDIGEGPQKISSLTELRTIESQSLRKAANGEGAIHIFRGFSQNRSNRDRNSLAGTVYETNRQVPVNRRTNAGDITARAISERKAKRRG